MWRWFKYGGITLAALGTLLLLLLAFTQTGMFRNWLRQQFIARVNPMLNGTLEIERLQGNLFSGISLEGITVQLDGRELLALSRLKLAYDPFRLFERIVQVDSLRLDSLRLRLQQRPDSTWNITRLMKPDTAQAPSDSTAPLPEGWVLQLADIQLQHSWIDISAPDTLLPRRIEGINSRLSARYSNREQWLDLKYLRLQTRRPDIALEEMRFQLEADEAGMDLNGLVIRTARNRVDGAGSYKPRPDTPSQARIEMAPLETGEFQFFLPDLQLPLKPQVQLETVLLRDSLRWELQISGSGEQLRLQGGIAPFSGLLQEGKAMPRYRLDGELQHINLARWMKNPELPSSLSGRFQLSGRGLTAEDAVLTFRGNLDPFRHQGYSLHAVRISGSYDRGDGRGSLAAGSSAGDVNLTARLQDLLHRQHFSGNLRLRHLDLGAFTGRDDSLHSDINLGLSFRGSGFDPAQLKAQAEVFISPSSAGDIPLDTLYAQIKVHRQSLQIDTLFAAAPYGTVALSGFSDPAATTDLRLGGTITDLSRLQQPLGADTLRAAGGSFSARVRGSSDSLHAAGEILFSNLVYNTVQIESIRGNLEGIFSADAHSGQFEVGLAQIRAGEYPIDQIALNGRFRDQQADLRLEANHPPSLAAALDLHVVQDSLLRIAIPAADITVGGQHWHSGSDTMRLTIEADRYTLRDLRLTAPGDDAPQEIAAAGIFSLSGEEDLRITLAQIDVAGLTALAEAPTEAAGKFDLALELTGTAQAPLLQGRTRLTRGKINNFYFHALDGGIDYREGRLNGRFAFYPTPADSLRISGFLPVDLAIDNPGERVQFDQPFGIDITAEGLPLTLLQALPTTVKNVRGRLISSLHIGNTLNLPQSSGSLRLENGGFQMPAYGIDYSDIQAELRAENERISLESFQIRREKGLIKARGHLVFDSSLVSGSIQTSRFEMNAEQFLLAQNRDFEIQLGGTARFSGNISAAEFGGNITVLRSSFYLPAFIDQAPEVVPDEALPMLVAATAPAATPGDASRKTAQQALPRPATEPDPAAELFENLRGSLKLSIPKNTWIKSPELRMELSGDLDIVKNGPYFEIFGPVRVVRGQYDIMGRRFKINQGVLTFQGGSEYDPQVDLKASYVFRTQAREKKTLLLQVGGKASQPDISFYLDDSAISEGDAISYLIFGRSMNELTQGQRSGLAAGGGNSGIEKAGLSAGLGMVSAKLSRFLGNKFNLDYVEIKGEDNWQSATFVAGKYITNDLFMSYEKSFGRTQSEDIASEVITLEYELTRFLFLQLIQGDPKASGAEIIFKFERE